jgi:glyoxylase-like metal-dependent hydrolase (beta-lactamase superfamily II)
MSDPQIRQWTVGEVTITRIVEDKFAYVGWSDFFADGSPELARRHDWVVPRFITVAGEIVLPFQAFVVTSCGRRIMVDTCIGNDKPRPIELHSHLHTPFLDDLAAAGFPAESIDTVLCTHLHFDHVGWNTRLVDGRWVPTFPNARYLFGRKEWEHTEALLANPEAHSEHVLDSIRPIIDAGLSDFVESDHRVTDEVWLEPTPGHTPGHVSVHIASVGQHAVITGDLMHNPVQIAEPDLRTHFCADSEAARKTRRAFLEHYQDRGALVFGSHFCDPTAGWIVRDGRHWRFDTD